MSEAPLGWRQGDVYFVRVTLPELPPVTSVVNHAVVVEGEITQHCHTAVGTDIRVHELTPETLTHITKNLNSNVVADQIVGLYSTDNAVSIQHGKLEHLNKDNVVRDHSTFTIPDGMFIAIRQVEGAGVERRFVQD